MAANLDGWSRTRSLLCGERTGRQAAALFGGARMVGLCLIWIPGSASIIKRKKPAVPSRGILVGSVVGRYAAASDISVRKPLQVDEARRMRRGIEIALFGRRLRRSSSGLRVASCSL